MNKSVTQLIAEADEEVSNVANKIHALQDQLNNFESRIVAAETDLEKLKQAFELNTARLEALLA